METLHSIKDPRVVGARALTKQSERMSQDLCQLWGEQQIRWALEAGTRIQACFLADQAITSPLVQDLAKRGIDLLHAGDGVLKKIPETRYLVPVIAIAEVPRASMSTPPGASLLPVLDHLQDPGNIGTVIRTVCGFGAREIVAIGSAQDLYSRRAIDASRGRVFHLTPYRIGATRHAVDLLKAAGYRIVATSPHSRKLQSSLRFDTDRVALVVGNETHGVSDGMMSAADDVVRIPMDSQLESLNVGVAAGISLYEMKVKVLMAMFAKEIRSTLGRELNVAAMLYRQAFEAAVPESSPLSGPEAVLMMILRCDTEMTIEQVAVDMGIDTSAVPEILAPLVADGCVTFSSPRQDSVRITDHGAMQLAQIWPLIDEIEADLTATLTQAERATLLHLLSRIQERCARTRPQGSQ